MPRDPASRSEGGPAHQPVANGKPYRELTPASMIGGILVGLILNMGICYAGLQIGFTIVGSAVAAVLGFGLLRGILRRGSILEVNIFQTVASSVNTVNAGIIFTVPVLFLLGLQEEINYAALILAAVGGSLLGVVMIIPLRKQIIDFERLRFPEGTAVGAILKSPGAGVQKAKLLVAGFVFSAIISVLAKDWTAGEGQGGSVIREAYNLGEPFGLPPAFSFVFAVSLLSLGAGYLAGRPGLVVLYGTLLNYWVLVPIAVLLKWVPEAFQDLQLFPHFPPEVAADPGLLHEAQVAAYARGEEFIGRFAHFTSRHVGIGMILGGAIAGILVALPAIRTAIKSLREGGVSGGRREEVSMRLVGGCLALGVVMLFLAAKLSGGDAVNWTTAAVVTVAGSLWLWLAGLVVAQTTGRTDWSPISGLALIAIAIMMGIMGIGREYVVPAVTVGAAVCVATSMCADMMADLKTGYLVGGMPRKQQIAQIATSWIGPAVSVVTVIILWKAYAFGPDQSALLYERRVADAGLTADYEAARDAGQEALDLFVAEHQGLGDQDDGYEDRVRAAGLLADWQAALQAGEEAQDSFVEEHRGLGGPTTNPQGTPKLGAPQAGALEAAINIVQSGDVPLGKYLTGALLGIVVSLLVSPGIGVMVGLSMYLPFEYMIVFGIGGILNILIRRWRGARFAEDMGVPVAAGLIVGDALVGVAHAVFKVVSATAGVA